MTYEKPKVRFTHREIDGCWYTWDEETDRPVSAGKRTEAAAKGRADWLMEGVRRLPNSPNVDRILREFDEWSEKHGHTDPLIARLRVAV